MITDIIFECLALDRYQIENGKIINALPASTETNHIRKINLNKNYVL